MLLGTRRIRLAPVRSGVSCVGASQNMVWAQSKAAGGFIDSSTGAGLRPKLSAGEISGLHAAARHLHVSVPVFRRPAFA